MKESTKKVIKGAVALAAAGAAGYGLYEAGRRTGLNQTMTATANKIAEGGLQVAESAVTNAVDKTTNTANEIAKWY